LPLQMALYFNAFYFPFWLVTAIIMLAAKVSAHCIRENNLHYAELMYLLGNL